MEYEVVFRDIKYPRIELKTGKPVLVLPHGEDPQRVLNSHRKWLEGKLAFIDQCLEEAKGIELFRRSPEGFKKLVLALLEKLLEDMQLPLQQVFFRRMCSKWASLSSKGNLTVNTLLSYLPEELIEYVLFHELTHFKEKKHNSTFFNFIAARYPDYREKEKELLTWWFAVQRELS